MCSRLIDIVHILVLFNLKTLCRDQKGHVLTRSKDEEVHNFFVTTKNLRSHCKIVKIDFL